MAEYAPKTNAVKYAWDLFRAPFLIRKSWYAPGDTVRVTGPEFDRWLNQIKAEAWAEGYLAARAGLGSQVPNPYRKEGG